jgi:hypothetical protein
MLMMSARLAAVDAARVDDGTALAGVFQLIARLRATALSPPGKSESPKARGE